MLADIRARGYGAWRFDDTHQSLHHRLASVLASLEHSVTDELETLLSSTEFVVLPIFGQDGQPEYQIEIHLGQPVGLTLRSSMPRCGTHRSCWRHYPEVMSATMEIPEIRRAADRAVTRTPWLKSRHSFSFGDHYDPDNTHHGLLLVNNDDIVEPGTGFGTHPHRDMEIVTWVLQGELTHRDSAGNRGVVYPGLAQRMSAGSGILHSEKNDSHTERVHFVQMWVVPDVTGISPGYQQCEIDADLMSNDLVTIATGIPGHDAAISLHNRSAALHGARLRPGAAVELPAAPYLHLFVPRGRLDVEGIGELQQGDAVRFTDADGRRVTADEPSEVLIWEMHAKLGG